MNYKQLPPITNKQKEIIDLVFKFRFINRHQIQKLFNHKDSRRINTWLKDLVSKNYLGRIYSKKLLENTKPAIYFLSNNGIIFMRSNKGEEYQAENEQLDFRHMKKFYEDKNASQTFIDHCIAISEFYTQFKGVERNSKKDTLEYDVQTKTEMWIYKQLHHDPDEDFTETKQFIPDLYIEKVKNLYDKTIQSQTYFLELFDPHVPRYAIVHKIKQFIKLKEDGSWKLYAGMDGKCPTFLLIFPHYRKINMVIQKIREQLEQSYESGDIIFLTTTYQKAITEGITNNIWTKIKEEYSCN
ncbi:MAG: replication-relaxation family protein [Patescibacteria group bacterium]|nr:replication-relaxation family protein [Patescibacteria group bacterium]